MNDELQNTYTQLDCGILTRTLYDTPSGDGYGVEIRDLLVGPGQHSEGVVALSGQQSLMYFSSER